MDRVSEQHVREQSTRPKREAQPNRSFAESPPSQFRSTPARTKNKKQSNTPKQKSSNEGSDYYTIKSILDQKKGKGTFWYLVDWDDNSQTGEKYDPSWVEAKDVTKPARREWKAKKKKKQQRKRQQTVRKEAEKKQQREQEKKRKRVEIEEADTEVPQNSSLDSSQPVRPAKRRKRQDPSSKDPWCVRTAQTARFSISQDTEVTQQSQPSYKEIKDSYEEESLGSSIPLSRTRVEISPFPSDFDYSAFQHFSARESGPSQISESSQSLQVPQSSGINLPLKTPRQRSAFIWDEDISPIIPDSVSGSSSYRAPATQIPDSSLPTSNSVPDTLTGVSEASKPSSSEIPSQESANSYLADPAPTASSEVAASGPATCSTIEQFAQVDNYSYHSTENSKFSIAQNPSDIPENIPANPALPRSEVVLPEEPVNSTQDQESEVDAEDLNFLTQVPVPSCSASTLGLAYGQFNSSPQHNAQFESQAQYPHQSSPSQSQVFLSEEYWQGAQEEPEFLSSQKSDTGINLSNHSHRLSSTTENKGLDEGPESIHPSIEQVESSALPPRLSPPSSGFSKLPDTYEGNFPPRPLSSIASMADENMETPPKLSVPERLKAARMKAQLETIAKQDARREAARLAQQAESSLTPASIPSTPALPPPPANASQMIPLREVPIVVPVSSPQQSPSPLPESPTSLHILPLAPKQFVAPLGLTAFVRDLYKDEIDNVKRPIKAFLNGDDISPDALKSMSTLIERLKMMCDHQDLILKESMSQNLKDDEIAKWAENISTKCVFIIELLTAIRNNDTHIVILVRSGRMLEILEACLRYHRFSFVRLDQTLETDQAMENTLQVTLVPTDLKIDSIQIQTEMVIAFDSTFEQVRHLKMLRGDSTDPSVLAPLVNLAVVNSVEHLELCIEDGMKSWGRLAALVSGVRDIYDEAGKLADDYLLPDAAARAVAAYVTTENADWPLLTMPGIDDVDVDFGLSNLPDSRLKRPLEDNTETESSKRQRMSPEKGEGSGHPDQTHISDAVLNSSSRIHNSKSAEASLLSAVDDASQQDAQQVASLMKRVAELENALQEKAAREADLRQYNQRLESQCKDYESSMQVIQPKYQEALNDRGHFEHELREAIRKSDAVRKRYDGREEEITRLRTENKTLGEELRATRAVLISSEVPEVAQFHKAKEELAAVTAERDRLQKLKLSNDKDIEYMRGNYQNASSLAAETANDLRDLKEEKAVLQRKASENSVRIHEIQASNEAKEYISRIDQLTAEKGDLTRELERKIEEIKALSNGRRGTRGSSAPRSPRMNNTMSPSMRGNRVLGVTSRGNSPGPGEPRNMFADAPLFPPTRQWPNHLTNG